MVISNNAKTTRFYQRLFLFASVFFAVFAFIYEMFSHGVYSAYMIFAFLIPLVLGGIPMTLLRFFPKFSLSHISLQTYTGGIFMLTIGSICHGILDIYGTTNQKLILFPIFGICLLITSFIQRAFMVD